VITARRAGGNRRTFECRDIESKQNRRFKYEMVGMLEAMDSAASMMKDPKDTLLIDIDNQGEWKMMTKDQMARVLRVK